MSSSSVALSRRTLYTPEALNSSPPQGRGATAATAFRRSPLQPFAISEGFALVKGWGLGLFRVLVSGDRV